MAYREIAPPAALASHVACLWWRDGVASRVLPDGCADLVWTGVDLVVAGPATRPITPRVNPGARKLGVRFRVGAAGAALGMPAAHLLDSSPPVSEVWADGEAVVERVAEAPDARARLGVMVEIVGERLSPAPAPDRFVRASVLELTHPGTRMAGVAERLGISERQLRRRFQSAAGYPPRTLARVLRLQRFLSLAERDGRDLARLAADAGYADQPHLTRDCTRLTGLPAAALLATGAGPAGERLKPI